MATSYSTLLGMALPVQGDLSGAWGDTVNNYITTYLDAAVAGAQTLSVDANVTLTKTTGAALNGTSSQYAIINCTGARAALRTITVPAASKIYVVINGTTGGFGVKLVGSGPTTGITIAAGTKALVAWNGSDFVVVAGAAIDLTSQVTGTLPVANGGTGVASAGTSGNVLTSNGTVWVSSPLFVAGTRMPFAQAAAPTGWVQDTTDNADNRMLRVVSTAGGGIAGTHSPILNNVVPSHTHGYSGTVSGQSADHAHYTSGNTGEMSANASHAHSISDPGHSHSIPNGYYKGPLTGGSYGAGASSSSLGYLTDASATGIGIYSTNTDHTHTWGAWSGGVNANHDHTYSGTSDNGSSQTNWAPRYIDMIICAKS